jgi:radical SAM superfamily enzyme YgiQ (UPF0313 family)
MAPPVLINPNLVLLRHDPFTSGIVYMPVSLAYFAGALRATGITPQVIDAFGSRPNEVWETGRFVLRGLHPREAAARIPVDAPYAVVYAMNSSAHFSVVELCKAIRRRHPSIPIVVQENTQAVTAYSLARVAEEFYSAGADYILTGESEERGLKLHDALSRAADRMEVLSIDGVGGPGGYTQPQEHIRDLDCLAYPAWDLFPLENYWRLGHAHGPQQGRYLPLLTSRGCPYSCRFCVIPETNRRRWRARSPASVVAEMDHWGRSLGIREFHLEDLNPTVRDDRIRELCRQIVGRGLRVSWKLVSGTKVETIKSAETISLMAAAGCKYISISPESGSLELLAQMQKSFDVEHAISLIRAMNRHGIRSQACFILGFPGETGEDRRKTRELACRMTREGLDEIAAFIVTPIPGSAIAGQFHGFQSYSELSFSPSWREDYEELNAFRLSLYRSFLLAKLRYHPVKLLAQPWRFLVRRYETKMEMAPRRALNALRLFRKAKPFESGGDVWPARQPENSLQNVHVVKGRS